MLKCAIVGVGGLGKVHLKNMIEIEQEEKDVELIALCDVEEKRFTEIIQTNLGSLSGPVDLSCFNLYTNIHELLLKEDLDFIITALPTYLHAKIANLAMEKGVHVFSEKPMALSLNECQSMLDTSEKHGKKLMIGQCLRYWPEYIFLKSIIDSEKYGKVIRAEFSRYSMTPMWTWENWMMDSSKSGGALLDMHIHDVDFISYAFGMPEAVYSKVTHHVSKYDSVFTFYQYGDKMVTASCDWGLPHTYPFTPHYLVKFENATLEMSSDGLKLYKDDACELVNPGEGNPYKNEVKEFIECIRLNSISTINPPESSMLSIKIALAERESSIKGGVVYV